MKRFYLLLLSLGWLPGATSAQKIEVRVCESSYAVFLSPARPELRAVVTAAEAAEGVLTFDIRTDTGTPVCTYEQRYSLHGNDSLHLGFGFEAAPGFYRAVIRDGEREAAAFNFGCDPEQIDSPMDAQPDFDEFWARARAELDAVAPRYRMRIDRERSTSKRRIYLVEMRSLGGEIVRGYYAEPVAEGKYPVVVYFLGYGSGTDIWCPDADATADRAEFVFSHRGQGFNKPENRYGDWIVSGIESPETYYYRGAYMDVVRAIDFVASRPKVDTRMIFAEGGSQGGALTLAACALDGRIAAAVPSVPFMSDFPDYLTIAPWPASALLPAAEKAGIDRSQLLRTLSYFDIKNLAGRIRCPILMGFGLQDDICPPHTNFSGYNQICAPKIWRGYVHQGHDLHNAPGWYAERDGFLLEQERIIRQTNNIN